MQAMNKRLTALGTACPPQCSRYSAMTSLPPRAKTTSCSSDAAKAIEDQFDLDDEQINSITHHILRKLRESQEQSSPGFALRTPPEHVTNSPPDHRTWPRNTTTMAAPFFCDQNPFWHRKRNIPRHRPWRHKLPYLLCNTTRRLDIRCHSNKIPHRKRSACQCQL